MDRLISCEFNMDTACVELKFLDGSMIAIDTIAVENEVADNMYQRSELDYLIYNDPVGYADLILNGDPEIYLKNVTECVNAASFAIGKSAEVSCPAFSIPSSRLIFSHCSFIFVIVSAGTFSASQASVPTGNVLPSYMTVSCQKSNVINSWFMLTSCPVFSLS